MSDDKPSKPHRGLGRGLSALMADARIPNAAGPEAAPRRPDRMVPIEQVRPNPNQPRRDFAREELEELAKSIREHGILQPLIVRPDPEDPAMFQIVAGERRWRAAQLAPLHEVPVIVRNFDDREVLEVAIIENIQRADLNPVEEAMGYKALMETFGHTQERLAEALGKSRSHIANAVRLLNLPEDVLEHLRAGRITAGHARALLSLDDPSAAAREVIAKGLNVRQVEQLGRKKKPETDPAPKPSPAIEKDADTRALEADLYAATGLKVEIQHQPGTEAGRVVVHYTRLDDLDRVVVALNAIEPAGSR